jgi:hypothetical protein
MGIFMACNLFKYFRKPKSKSTEMGGTYVTIAGEEKFLQGFGGQT